jgi:hypothetical protein
MKQEAVNRLGGQCKQCGWKGNLAGFHFHHRDPKEKEFTIGSSCTTNWEKYWKEVQKCDLLCSICHDIFHSDYSNPQFLLDVEKYEGRDFIESDISWKNKIHISTYEDQQLAEQHRDACAKYLGIATYKYHDSNPLSPDEAKIRNPTKGTKVPQKEKLFSGISLKEYQRQTNGKVGLFYNSKRGNWEVNWYSKDARHYLGSFKDQERAQEIYDLVDSDKLTVNEAKYQSILDSNDNKRPGIIVRQNQNSTVYVVRISGVKEWNKSKTLPVIKNESKAIYLSIALRNYYDLPTDLSITQDKLSFEEAKSLA